MSYIIFSDLNLVSYGSLFTCFRLLVLQENPVHAMVSRWPLYIKQEAHYFML